MPPAQLSGWEHKIVMVKVTSEGHISVKVIKVYIHTKQHVYADYYHQEQTKTQRLSYYMYCKLAIIPHVPILAIFVSVHDDEIMY